LQGVKKITGVNVKKLLQGIIEKKVSRGKFKFAYFEGCK
jgi:hypothetical protein